MVTLLCVATALSQMIVDKTKLRAWDGKAVTDSGMVVDAVKAKEAALASYSKFDNIAVSGSISRPQRIASTDASLSPNDVIDDGTRIKFNVVNWFSGDFLGIGAMRPVSGTQIEEVFGNSEIGGIGGGVYANGKWYGLKYGSAMGQVLNATFYVYDAETWEVESSVTLPSQWYSVYDNAAYNPKDGQIYVLGYDGMRVPYLSTLDVETGTYTRLVQCNVSIAAMAFSSDGILYAITSGGELEQVDLTTGAGTALFRVEDEGVSVDYWQSMAFDYHTGELFWIRTDNSFNSSLRLIDIAGRTVKTVSELPSLFGTAGAWVDSPEAPDNAPDTVAAINVEFPEGNYIGEISATAPSTTFGGGELTGDVALAFSVDGRDTGTVTVAAGEIGTVQNVDFQSTGEHKVTVTASNAAGSGPSGTITAYCGPDTPNPVTNVVLSIDDSGMASLSWDAPTAGIHNGIFDADKLTYTIVRNPDNVTVAENQKATTFSEQLPTTLSRWSYSVTVACDGVAGEAVASNSVVYGDGYTIPFSTQLGNEAFFNLCTVYDNDGDGTTFYTTWGAASCYSSYIESGFHQSDDWLITAPIYLEEGNYLYELVYAATGDGVDATFTMGDKPVPEVQTTVLGTVENLLYSDGQQTLKLYIKAEKAGKYYFGINFHSESPVNGATSMPYGTFRTLSITAGPDDDAPAKVGNLKVTPFAEGEQKTTVSFTAPTATYGGGTLRSITRIDVCNANDAVIATVADVQPGEEYSVTDESAAQGVNTYHVYAYNDYGQGELAEISAFAGNDIPGYVQNMTYSIADNRTITLNWDAPTSGVNGGYVDPAGVTYDFCRSEYDYLTPFAISGGRGLTERTFTYEENSSTFGTAQHMYFYGVQPVNSMGTGPLLYSGFVLGNPYSMPFKESLEGGTFTTSLWATSLLDGSEAWQISAGSGEIQPSDEDGGMLLFSASGVGLTGHAVVSPILELKDMKKPVLVYDMYHLTEATSAYLSVQVSKDEAVYQPVELAYVNDGTTGGWKQHKVALDAYNGSSRVFIAFLGASEGAVEFAIDNIQVYDDIDTDIAVTSFSAPSKLGLDETGDFIVEVVSRGNNDIDNFSIDFYADGVKVKTVEGGKLQRNVPVQLTAQIRPNAANANKTVEYEARVNLDSDENELNDSAVAMVEVTGSLLPAPVGLTGETRDGNIDLSWGEPSASVSEAVEESFDSYEAFAITSQGEWTFVDNDRLMPTGIGGVTYPNMDQGRAYMVWNPTSLDFPGKDSWSARTGEQCLIAFASDNYKLDGSWDGTQQSDEWLISPHVAGGTTVAFYASSPVQGYTERFEFLISYGSKNLKDFTLLGEQVVVSETGWKRYEYQLPADAAYFAIRYCSQGAEAFALLIDDIDFTAGYGEVGLIGYNVYENGVLVNSEPVETLTYTLPYDSTLDYVYGVSAVYDEGESEMVTLEKQGGVDGLVQESGVTVTAKAGSIVVEGAAGQSISVYNTYGQLVMSGLGTGMDVFAVGQPAIYIVKVGNGSYKVIVR